MRSQRKLEVDGGWRQGGGWRGIALTPEHVFLSVLRKTQSAGTAKVQSYEAFVIHKGSSEKFMENAYYKRLWELAL